MSITMKDIKSIKSDLAKRRPPRLALDENQAMTTKEAIMALAPELNKMKTRGFSTTAIVEILKEHKISIKGATLNRYINEHKNTIQADAPDAAVQNPKPTQGEKTKPFFTNAANTATADKESDLEKDLF